MEYLHVSLPGESEYFPDRYSCEDDGIEEYLSLDAYYTHQNNFAELPDLDLCPIQEKKQEGTLDLTDDVPPNKDTPLTSPQEAPSLPLVALVPSVRQGIIFSQKSVQRYRTIFRGSKDDTVQLNINFRTLLVHYFRELRMINQLNEYEIAHLAEFADRVPSFNSFMLFLRESEENEGVRARALEFFSSTECIKRIMMGRARMKTKLQMVKFIEKMRLNILTKGKGYKWKDVVKKID